MKKILIHNFGVIVAVVLNILMYMMNVLLYKIDYTYNTFVFILGADVVFLLDFMLVFALTLMMILYVIFKDKNWKLKPLLLCYTFFMLVFERAFNNFLLGLNDLTNNFFYNSDSGIIWIILVPMNFIVVTFVGFVFDYIKNKKIKDYKRKKGGCFIAFLLFVFIIVALVFIFFFLLNKLYGVQITP